MFEDLITESINEKEEMDVAQTREEEVWDTGRIWSTGQVPKDVWVAD